MASSAVPDDALAGPVPPGVRPRYGRITAFGLSALVTATAVLGGLGVLPAGGTASHAATQQAGGNDGAAAASLTAAEQRVKVAESAAADSTGSTGSTGPIESAADEPDPDELLVPEDSGEGRRVVFDEGAQRVWLVNRDGSVERTYLVSGSVYDNLDPGTYSVFSRDKLAWGIDGSELRYMVRFTTGAEAAIGFHNIPVLEGTKVQTPDELGTPLSHGCIRQWGQDAQALWDFAPLGTTVVVVDTSADTVDLSDEE
jgi:L,D-transpeptidase catalytic domain